MRLQLIAGLIDKCSLLMDVGCDHGLVSRLVLDKKLADSVIATDISEKCLAKAKKTLRAYKNVAFVAGDGIVETDTPPDFIVICGMGGHTISDILSRYKGRATLLLSPHSHPEQVRQRLAVNGYTTVHDKCYTDRGKYYDIIKAVPGATELPDALHLKYGRYEEKNDALKARLIRMLSKLPEGSDKYAEIKEVLKWQE